uniref:Uncharacterized protein n=1 Tax=Parascaris univalens TaxID=6257 RepID=A0A914ZG82_PARUN
MTHKQICNKNSVTSFCEQSKEVNGTARAAKAAKGLKRVKTKYEENVWVGPALGSDRPRVFSAPALAHSKVAGISHAEVEVFVERGTAKKSAWKRFDAKRFLSSRDGAGILANRRPG